MKHFYIKIILLLTFSFISIPGIYSQSTVTTVINYSGFQACGGCTVCGADYWCTNTPGSYCGNTLPCMDKTFFDPVPAGNVITSITVNYWTASCEGAAIYGTFANSSSNEFIMPVAFDGNSGCWCSDLPCMLTTSSSISFPCGIPGYIYGGNNIFKLCSSGPMCINRAEIVFTYWNVNVFTPTITASSNPLCAGESTTLNVVSNGYTAYLWSTGATSQSITVTPATTTTYGVTVTTATGCTTAHSSITITVNPRPTVTATASPATICNGQCTNLTAGGASTYYWMPGTIPGSTYNVCPTTTTTYTVGGISAAGCSNSTTVSVNVNPNVTPTFNAVGPYCSGAAIPALPTTSTNGITGTWSPAINNAATTTYTFTPTAGQCATTTTLTITINPNVTPTFNAVGPYCSGAAIPALPTTSTNGVTGTWSPAINNTATTTYTFTPTPGLCAATTTLTITINPTTTPTFNAVGPYCSGAAIPALPTTSTNGITGTWSPAINNTATTTYTFTPTPGLCAATTTLTITINPNVTPTFNAVGPYCSGAAIPALPTTSTNGITGTWSPAINNTATTTYTFTHTPGLCATNTTLTITINPNITPTFNAVGPYCSGAAIPALPTTSTNGVTGTWSPAINNTATTTYTFTPTPGLCATTTTLTITINPSTTPTFNAVGPYCSGAAIPALPTTSTNGITGTWSPAINNTATTTYTFTPTPGLCAATTTLTITINPNITPTFNAIGPYCSGAAIPALPTTSTNGITGTWSPAINNTVTTTYTFTPTPGLCATTATLTITVNPIVTPTFNAVGPYCSGAAIPALPTTSTNGITGTWSPAINNTATTTYTFTPTPGLCATTTTLTITVNPNTTPTFNAVGPYCSGAAIPALPTTSTNGITGTWSPAINNTATTTYTFTPTPGLCATTATLTITVNPSITPTFNAVGPYCSGAAIPALPTTSTNGITGTWSPAINNTTTTTYTFTPTPGLCATTTTLTITVNPNITPTFNAVGPYCSGAAIPALPTTSTNGITGTWSPAINNTTTTTYTFTPTPGLCATTTTLTITVNSNITPTFNAVGPYCSGAAISALPTTSTNGITGTWSPAINNTTTTTYTFTPTPGLCATNATMIITVNPLPTANAGSDQNLGACTAAANATLNGSGTGSAPLSYSWSPATGLSNPNIANPVADPASTTTYTLTVTDTYGCTATDAVSITVNPIPTANAGADQNLGACAGAANASLNGSGTGTGPLAYSWLPATGLSNANIANPVADPASTTTYTLTVTDTYGCTATDAVIITVNPVPTANAGTDQNLGACAGASNANLNGSGTGTGPLVYSWLPVAGLSNPNISNPVADPASTTTYTLTVTDTYGCTATDGVIITVNPIPTANAGADQNLGACAGAANASLNGSGTGTGPLAYSWLPTTGLSNANIANPVADPASTTTYTLTVTDTYGCTASDDIIITVNPIPTANAGADQDLGTCATATSALLNGLGTGTGPLVFSWLPATGLSNPNISNPTADPTATTVYTLTVTDVYGCTATDAVTISIQPLPTASAGTDQNLGSCAAAANANLNGVGTGIAPITYSWLPAAGLSNPNIANPSADPASTTTYTLTVTDVYGCTATDAVIITVNPLPTANAGADQNLGACAGAANANLNGVGTGTVPLTYSWLPITGLSNPNIANPVADPSATTTYTLTVTDTYGCSATDAILITVNPLPTADAGNSQNLGACASAANANLAGIGTGTAPLSYSWLPAAGLSNPNIANPIADPASTTNYSLTVTDVYGCTATDIVTITIDPLPTSNAGTDQNIGACSWSANANLNGTGTGTIPITYSWLPAAGLSNPGIPNPIADPASTTTYTLTITDSYGCSATDAVLITVDPLPTVNAGADQNIGACATAANANLNAIATGIAPLTYSWTPTAGLNNPNIANPVADPASTTTYTLTVSDSYGCTATDAVMITVNPAPTASAGADQNLGACPGAANANINGTGTGTGPLIYSWTPITGLSNPNIANPVADPTSTTTYTFTVTDIYGCTATDDITITVDVMPTANAGSDQHIGACGSSSNANINGIGTGTGPLGYAWMPVGGLSDPNIANPVANPSATTTYTLTVTDIYGCTATDDILITVDPLPTANAGVDQTVGACSNAANANINATATGIAPLTYSWLPVTGLSNPGILNPVADPAVTTTYTLTVTDIFGCTATDNIVITVAPLPTVNAGANQYLGACLNAANANINSIGTGTPPLTYSWSPPTGLNNPNISNPVADPSVTTNYIVTLTDMYGCSVTDDITIFVDPLPTSNAGSDQSIGACTTSPAANLSGSGTGTNPLTYSWTPTTGVTNPNNAFTTAHPFNTTVYTLVVTDAYGCTATDNAVVTVAAAPAASAGPDASIGTCSWSIANLNGSATGAAPFGYSWTPTLGLTNSYIANPQAHPLMTTVYTLTVTDTYGCTAQDFATVSVSALPIVSVIANPSTICATFSSNLNAFGALTYSWSPATGLSATTGQNVTATPPSTTTYTVTGSDQFTCTASAQTTITVIPNPVVTVTPASPAICFGGNVTLTANGATSYTWIPTTGLSSSNTPVVSASPNATITYTVTGVTSGCNGSTTVMVTVNPLPVVTFAPLNQVCLNDTPFTLTQGSPAGGSYTGNGITNTNTFNPSIAGVGTHQITYTYTDNNNCVNTATQSITVKPNPVMTVTPDNVNICLGTSVSFVANGADTYLWSPDNTLSSSVGSAVTATPTSPTVYTVVGTTDGCTASESATVNTYTTIPIAVTPPTDSLCPGESAIFTASGALNYTWLPIEGLSSYSTPTVVSTPATTTVYTVFGSDNDGCTGTASVAVVIYPEAFLHFTVEPHEGCTPLTVEFNYIPDGTLDTNTLHWNFGDLLSVTDISDQTSDSYTYTAHGNYFIMLTGTSVHGCNAVGYDTVFAFKSPEASFYPNPEVAETNNPLIEFFDESYYTTHWTWDFGDPPTDELNSSNLQFPQHVYSDSGSFIVMLIASNDYNCSDTAIRTVQINESFVFYMPNAFTPNDNGINDGFIGKGVGYREEDFEMYIFDRWGKKMFYTQDCYEPWDGYNANGTIPCEAGVYVWLINITEQSGIKHVLKGTVTLYR